MMRTRIVIVTLVSVLLALVAWWFSPDPPRQPEIPVAKGQPTITPAAPLESSSKPVVSTPSAEELAKTPEEKREQYVLKAIEYGRSVNRPINFYGQIVDQNNQPVAGVKVKCETSYFGNVVLPGLMPHNKQFERISDNAGRFFVESESGLGLDVRLQPKEGYQFKPDAFGHTFQDIGKDRPAEVVSTRDSPYVFHAFRKGKAEALLTGSILKLCEQDGRFYTVDLKSKRITEEATGGDIKISLMRPPGPAGQDNYNWSVKMEGIDADLIESQDVFMYQAPASGYVSSWSFTQRADGNSYTREVHPKFYFKSRSGSTYGRIEMSLMSNYRDKFGVRIRYWLNPAGSRNLEPD